MWVKWDRFNRAHVPELTPSLMRIPNPEFLSDSLESIAAMLWRFLRTSLHTLIGEEPENQYPRH